MSWDDDLMLEVLNEFTAFGDHEPLSAFIKAGIHVIERADGPEREPMPPALRNQRLYARSVANGQCVKCSKPARPGLRTCAECSQKASERNRVRRQAMLQRGEREKLPVDRKGVTWHFTIHTRDNEAVKGYATANCYADGRLGELFVKMGKAGDTSAWIDEWAKDFSLLLQVGYPLDKVCRLHMHTQFDPCGGTNSEDSELKRCTSVVDLVCRWMLKTFAPPQRDSVVLP